MPGKIIILIGILLMGCALREAEGELVEAVVRGNCSECDQVCAWENGKQVDCKPLDSKYSQCNCET